MLFSINELAISNEWTSRTHKRLKLRESFFGACEPLIKRSADKRLEKWKEDQPTLM